MQVAEAKISSTAKNRIQAKRQPFFSKERQGGFFSKSAENTSSFFSPASIQPKLTIGQPNDKYEVEADAMADKVVQSFSNTKSGTIQTKCTDCNVEENLQKKEDELSQKTFGVQTRISRSERVKPLDDEENIQAKSNGSILGSSDLESRLNSSKRGGSAIPNNVRSSMESGFGADFSGVRVHTGSESVQMNKELGAQAFTHGNDIYFNQGKYRPETSSGKHLLAHELVHTVQQNGLSQIQRAVDPEFRITGKYENAASYPDRIYFDFSSSAIDSDEESKITALALSTSQNYDLIGYSSEEGGDSGNRQITSNRLNAVSNSFNAKGHTGSRNKRNEFRRGESKLDYRRLRRVDVLAAGVPSTEPDCSAGNVESCGTRFSDAFPLAISQAIRAHILMITAPFTGEQSRVENAVAALFGDASHLNTVKGHLGNLVAQISDQPNTVSCHNSCDRTCANASAYMDGTTGPGAVLTLCAPFYTNNNPARNAETLIHEALHATTGLATDDLAYSSERGITFLDSATALRNTDSYVLFIQELLNPGSILGGGGGNRDVIDAAITGTQLADLRRVMAYLEKWIIESTAETSSLYDSLVEVIAAGTWSGVSFPYYEDTMSFLAPLFGLTTPAAVPHESDQVAVAGIYDRLMRMDNLLWGTNLDIKKDLGPVRFSPGPTDPLFVNDAFLTSGQNSMVYNLLQKIVESNTSISSSHKAKYVALIEKIREHSGHAAPP